MTTLIRAILFLATFIGMSSAADFFIEAESLQDLGGWKLDTQFIQQMGSPYLLAHGLGQPVGDAAGKVKVPEDGNYRVWVRTFDWAARWDAKSSPGKFKISVGDKTLDSVFGTKNKGWSWHDGGTIELTAGEAEIRIKDLTGFDGRCDCIYFTTDADSKPPVEVSVLSEWRRSQLGLPEVPRIKGNYDLVVVGGGYAGMGTAISGARMGCKVALIQDRGVLGGNGSSEVRVWAMGNIRRGKYPRIGEIIEEFCDHATKSPGKYEEFGDNLKEKIVRAEHNIDLLLNHHAHAVKMDGDIIKSVFAFNVRTGEEVEIRGTLFADCTGHGWIGEWANADRDMTPTGRMGMSNMWAWDELESETSFPETPWALDLNMADFPYPRDHHGQWFWESGFDRDAIGDAEGIRDWNLRAVFGAFNAMKNRDGAEKHKTAVLTWVAFVGGPRESRRLMGDVVLTQEDVVNKRDFPDGCVPSTWSIDLHYPKEQYAKKFPANPFISIAKHDRRVDRSYGYPVPYRCFYSRNVNNLFMAGRNISVTHEALGTVRVMKTCGMMGEVVGKAASICVLEDCLPRDVYEDHLGDLLKLLELPGKAHRSSPTADIVIPDNILPLAGSHGPMTGKSPTDISGIVVDDKQAKFVGDWSAGDGLKNFVGWGYRYNSKPGASAEFTLKTKTPGRYKVEIFSQPHPNRSTKTKLHVSTSGKSLEFIADQRRENEDGKIELGEINVQSAGDVIVKFVTDGADGNVHVDAVRLLKLR